MNIESPEHRKQRQRDELRVAAKGLVVIVPVMLTLLAVGWYLPWFRWLIGAAVGVALILYGAVGHGRAAADQQLPKNPGRIGGDSARGHYLACLVAGVLVVVAIAAVRYLADH
ncbi:MAG TPA: hypothetical protein VFP37_15345 [Steroidobacteraceae bacterium]|nr:hypothetical protein [Steroidobacteraceae bacterium]